MNPYKTKVMHRRADNTVIIPQIFMEDFTYLSIVSHDTIDRELKRRFRKASAALGQLKDKDYLKGSLRLTTKIQVCPGILIAILRYGAEIWTLYSKQLNQLNSFHVQCH